ncbi:ribosome-inactivating protein SNAI-like [Cucurbita maxima]|uniref:Ribosome-inactivating protein SNAI-like n=1 Tax=Cucurbita maxima TaxID=3661 RepID=A0A6J1IYQ6_CUCMA|nr:ribosome-inactivating protein SNAI-like [Cucurbita maxima]
MEKMRQVLLCIALAFSLAIAAPSEYGAFGGRTHLVGRDGLCLDTMLLSGYYPQTDLSQCQPRKLSQLWTILEDGTIRASDVRYCLVPKTQFIGPVGPNVVVMDCTKEVRHDMKWTKKKDGTIHHDESGLVLTAKPGRMVTLEANEDAPSQSWEATESLYPMVANIKWLDNLCLKSREGENSYVTLNECSRDDKNQRWALYGDGTIRQNEYRHLCLTSSERNYGALVVVSRCADKPQQRWGLAEDNTINHPNTNLVMDVHREVPLLPPMIVVDKHDGAPSQRWSIY